MMINGILQSALMNTGIIDDWSFSIKYYGDIRINWDLKKVS